jgi:hypothetical protein
LQRPQTRILLVAMKECFASRYSLNPLLPYVLHIHSDNSSVLVGEYATAQEVVDNCPENSVCHWFLVGSGAANSRKR